ncbi:MAG TPA: DUF86 domain-containing protein [Gemmataceae bacterium]|nr:DUF86 domain-containing protein [Gemmataceae bacterium]
MSVDRRWQVRIEHILEAIGKIQRYSGGLTEDTFVGQSMAVDAVIRNFQVIGEAVRHVPDEVQARYPEVPWSLMQGMRHILVHDYYAVKLDVVWRTIQQSLPPLLEPLRRILNENP